MTNKKNKKKQKQKIEIIVTKHAIERYIQRTLSFDLSPTGIQSRLEQAAANGKRVVAQTGGRFTCPVFGMIRYKPCRFSVALALALVQRRLIK